MSDLKYWLALSCLPDIGPVRARKLLSVFKDPENIFNMPVKELKRVENRAESIAGFKQWDLIQTYMDRAGENNAKLITINDSSYPEGLRQTPDAPLVLFVKGDLMEHDKYAVALIGSRRSTRYGLQVAEKMGNRLAGYGLTVVSGMARGVDTASHRGALKAGGRTIAVLGSGIDVPYPPENRNLMESIASSGAVITEFSPGTQPNRENFPRRNRIISAMSFGVVVIEAAVDSGSLITVGYALEQGREVFAVPGNITSKTSEGTNALIKKGARLVENAEEVIDELGPLLKGMIREEKQNLEKQRSTMSDEEKALYSCLSNEPRHIDTIVRETNMATGKALSILLSLELKGHIGQADGKHFYIN